MPRNPQPSEVEVELVICRAQVQKRRSELALRRKRILIPELEAGEAGEVFLGEIDGPKRKAPESLGIETLWGINFPANCRYLLHRILQRQFNPVSIYRI